MKKETQIVDIFETISTFEKKSEIIRQVLYDSKDFDTSNIFTYLDIHNKQNISIEVFQKYFTLHSIYCDRETVKMFISQYDINKDGCLNLQEFKNLILPRFVCDSSSNVTSLDVYNNKMSSIIEYNLVKLFISEIKFSSKMVQKLRHLCSNIIYNPWNLFKELDVENNDYLTEEILEKYLLDLSIIKSKIGMIFRRMDVNKDSVISFQEFQIFFNYRDYSRITTFEDLEISNKGVGPTKHGFGFCHVLDDNKSFTNSNTSMKFDEKNLTERYYTQNNLNLNCFNTKLNTSSIITITRYINLDEEILINFFKFVINCEKDIEKVKNKLFFYENFNIVDVYFIFQNANNLNSNINSIYTVEKITKNEFKTGLNFYNVFPTEEELNFLFYLVNCNNDKLINFHTFSKYFFPLNSLLKINSNTNSNNSIALSNFLPVKNTIDYINKRQSLNVKFLINELFTIIINNETKIEAMRLKINKIKTFNIKSLFTNISRKDKVNTESRDDIKVSESFNQIDLEFYLRNFNILVKDEISLLFNRLDKQGMCKVSYLNVKIFIKFFSLLLNCFPLQFK